MHAHWLAVPAVLLGSTSGHAISYLSVEQAQSLLLPGRVLEPHPLRLDAKHWSELEHRTGLHFRHAEIRAWRSSDGEWFFVDEVLGKHEFITYALALSREGKVSGVEILDYRETYGGQVHEAAWRRQFEGKAATDPLTLDVDVRNISGATLSCRHLTDGIKRLLAIHAYLLSGH